MFWIFTPVLSAKSPKASRTKKWREMKDVRVFSLARSVTLKENCGLEFQERRGIEGQF